MASNFAFYPQGKSVLFTVGIATITFQPSLDLGAGTSTLSIAGGNYQPQGCRIWNEGTFHLSVQFATTAGPAITAATGMRVLAGTAETFRFLGYSIIYMLSPSGTVTIGITPGEGL